MEDKEWTLALVPAIIPILGLVRVFSTA